MMKKCFDIEEEVAKKEHKKSIVVSVILLLLIIIIETVLLVVLNRENFIPILITAIILFVVFSCFFSWFILYKRSYYKCYLKNIKKAQTELIEKEAELINISNKPFIKESLEYYRISFECNKKQIDLELLAANKDDFEVGVTYRIAYKGSVLFKYEKQ